MCYLQRVGSGFSFGGRSPVKIWLTLDASYRGSKIKTTPYEKYEAPKYTAQTPTNCLCDAFFFIIMKAPFLNSLSQQPFSVSSLSAAFRSSLSQQPSAAAFLSLSQPPFWATTFFSGLFQQPFSAAFLSNRSQRPATFLSCLSQQPFSAASSLSPFSAAFLSNLCQRPLSAAFCSSLSQQPFSASFCSSLSQQVFAAAFVSSLSQQPLSTHPFSAPFLRNIILLWSGVGGQLFDVILLWPRVGLATVWVGVGKNPWYQEKHVL